MSTFSLICIDVSAAENVSINICVRHLLKVKASRVVVVFREMFLQRVCMGLSDG